MKFIILIFTCAFLIVSAQRFGHSGGRGGYSRGRGSFSNHRFGNGGPFNVNRCGGNFQFVNGACICPPFASTINVTLPQGGTTQVCQCTTSCTAGQVPVFGQNCTCQAIPRRGWGGWF